jgi:hypothetical protein
VEIGDASNFWKIETSRIYSKKDYLLYRGGGNKMCRFIRKKNIATNVITLEKLIISNADIINMTPEIKRQYLMFTSMLEDLNLLQKLLLYIKIENQENEIARAAFLPPSLFVLKTLIGKIVEIWDFINSEATGILTHKEDFPEGVKTEMEKVELFFSDDKTNDLFQFIRDKLAFHYDTYPDIIQPISDFMNIHPEGMHMWLCRTDSGSDIFASTNEVVLGIIFQRMNINGFTGNNKNLMDKLVGLTIQVARDLREFCVQYLSSVILNNIKLQPMGKKDICVPSLAEIKLPLLVKADKKVD